MALSRTLGWASGGGSEPSGYRLRRQRYAAKLIALALFASVRSAGSCRLWPWVSVVPMAMLSYAAHASYIHVWAIASARATIGGPFRRDRLRRTSASAAAFQSLTTVADAEVTHTKVVKSVATAINACRHTAPSIELRDTSFGIRVWGDYGYGRAGADGLSRPPQGPTGRVRKGVRSPLGGPFLALRLLGRGV